MTNFEILIQGYETTPSAKEVVVVKSEAEEEEEAPLFAAAR